MVEPAGVTAAEEAGAMAVDSRAVGAEVLKGVGCRAVE
jgi:hypothetical protein